MSEIIADVNPESTSTASVQPSSANPKIAGDAAIANATKKDFSMSTEIGSLAELKKQAPEVHEKMMMGIAYGIVRDMRKHQERLKKMMREGRSR